MDSTTRHYLMDNSVQLYMRPNSPHWWSACSIGGKQRRATTKEESLARAKDVARDWYLGLMGKYRAGGLREGRTFREAAQRFIDEFEAVTKGLRSPIYVEGHKMRIKNHLNPFFGDLVLSEITAGKVQDYRIHRLKTGLSRVDQFKKIKIERERLLEARRSGGKSGAIKIAHQAKKDEEWHPPSRNTLHQEIVCLRQILKSANRDGWLDHLPNLSMPWLTPTKISHRAWFSPEEYETLYKATRKRSKMPRSPRWRWQCEQLHDLVLFMGNTGLRPDEALKLQFRDVEVVKDEATRKTILEIKVRGKRGVGYCKSLPGAVEPFMRLQKRRRPTRVAEEGPDAQAARAANARPKVVLAMPRPTDLVFPKSHRDLFKDVLTELGLRADREGSPRTLYSLRHTYISMRLMEGADIYQIAKNCRTSVEMIEKYYASHIKDQLDTTAINVRKRRKRKPKAKASIESQKTEPAAAG